MTGVISIKFSSYTENAVDEGVVAGVAHGEPVEAEEEDVDVLPSKIQQGHLC